MYTLSAGGCARKQPRSVALISDTIKRLIVTYDALVQNGDSRRRDDDALDRVDLERRVDDVLGAEQSWIDEISLSIWYL